MFRLLTLAALVAQVAGGNVKTCPDQAGCIKFSVEQMAANCGSTDCSFQICMEIDQANCAKDLSGDSISHTCVKDSTVCQDGGGFSGTEEVGNLNFGSHADHKKQCQIVGPGDMAEFLLKDANTQSCQSYTMPFSIGNSNIEAYCEGRDVAGVSSCTGNAARKECIWTVVAPTCGTPNVVTESPTNTPQTFPPIGPDATCPDLALVELHKFLLIGTVKSGIADSVNVQNGDLGADVIVLSRAIDNVGANLDDVFLNNAGSRWVDVDNDANTNSDYLPGAARVGEGVSWTGDIALTSPNGDYSMSNTELYGQIGVSAEVGNPADSVSNSLFFSDGVGDGISTAGGDSVTNHHSQTDMTGLRKELTDLENWISNLLPEATLSPGSGLPTSDGIEDVDVFELNVDLYDANSDGIAVIDIDMGGNDFKITNANWVIESVGYQTFAVIRIIGGSNLVLNQGTILLGDGILGNSFNDANMATSVGPETIRLNAMITKTRRTKSANGGWNSGESTSSGDTVFNFNDVVLNGVGIYDLIVFENEGINDSGTTEVVVNNGQGCTQFVSPKINFNNVRFEKCDFFCTGPVSRVAKVRGDPHWKRWDRKEFEWHGACDINFIKTSTIEIHVRTAITDWWSSVQSAVVMYGSTIFQVDTDKVWINKAITTDGALPSEIITSTVDGVKIYEVAVTTESTVIFRVAGPYLSVEVVGHSSDFADAVGAAGTFSAGDSAMTGKPLDRSGNQVSSIDGANYMPLWKVDFAAGDRNLFESAGSATCEMPTMAKPSRRHLRSSPMLKVAEEVCAGKENVEGCVSDVVTTGSTVIAGLW